VLIAIGFLLFGAGALCGVAANRADAELQRYRLPDRPAASYWFVPLRIRTALYQPEAAPLVRRAWRLIGSMYGLALLGMLLIALGSRR
jgi:hypothetical protein